MALCLKHPIINPLPAAGGFLFSIPLLSFSHAETKPGPICLIVGLKMISFCLINVINNVAESAFYVLKADQMSFRLIFLSLPMLCIYGSLAVLLHWRSEAGFDLSQCLDYIVLGI